jgi:hypothetical protein
LRDVDYDYKTTLGTPQYWYWVDTTTKKVGFYSVPDSNYNGRALTYDYEKEVEVTDVSDVIPLHTTSEFRSFIDMAARRFMYMIDTALDIRNLEQDPIYKASKATLYGLMRPINPSKYYGHKYG